ncbi:hypothetical protein HPB50_026613 [Hyalomma asiaticum]|uniref:Uncharacterized protein n=1 Tax=Hyalomma asiaticum TaxID=266040 RepID=A0ACB7TTT0_HYAAI|nr:hypothetical protein HPB50_026613 [Hyalomma asiaticum]
MVTPAPSKELPLHICQPLWECEAALPVDDEPELGSLELPGSFADYVGADDDVAVCSEVSLDDIIETVRPDTAGTSDEEEMDDAAEASVSVPTYADVLCYVDHIRRFACARDEIGDLLPDVAAIERKLMRRGWANSQKKITDFFKRDDTLQEKAISQVHIRGQEIQKPFLMGQAGMSGTLG